jgi:ectoine hydroxylase
LILENVFQEEEWKHYQCELEKLKFENHGSKDPKVINEPTNGETRSVFQIHKDNPVFRALGKDDRLVNIARYILDDDVYIHQSRINYKPGFRGKEFYWHSDFETWHTEDGMPRMRAISISVNLTDNYDINGALMLIPGSQYKYVSCCGETPEDNFKYSLKRQEVGVPPDEILEQLVEHGGIQTSQAKAGSIVIFDCNTMHGSNGNITPMPRSNAFFVYNAACNRVVQPFTGQKPRPEFIASREDIEIL